MTDASTRIGVLDRLRRSSLSSQILAGLLAGVATGIVIGERAAVLAIVAEAFIKLLQMTVLSYVMVSLVAGLGGLNYEHAKALALRAGAVLLLLWGVALAAVFTFPLMLPRQETASFFSTSLVEPREPFDLVSLYIPANPFNSLANSVVPAVVLFSVLVGVTLIGVPEKQRLLDVLAVVSSTLSRITNLVVRLMPYGLFAISATVAGTLGFEEVQRLQVYLACYIAVALLVTLWVLPGLVAALTPVPYVAVLRHTRDALLTAFMTSSLFIVLPMLVERTKLLVQTYGPPGPDAEHLPDVVVPASFNFPHVGKLLSLSFVLFAGWFTDVPIRVHEYPTLAATGLMVLFGNVNVAMPFLLDMWHIPADTFHLFEATSVINSRFGTLVATMHTAAIALLGTWAMSGGLRVDWRRVGRYVAITLVATLLMVVSVRWVIGTLLIHAYDKDTLIAGMQMLAAPQPATVFRSSADVPLAEGTGPLLDRIRARKVLRVGYLPDSLPFAYTNSAGDLVGFDVEMAHRLAAELGVRLELVPADRTLLTAQLADGRYCDLVMSGLAMTPARAAETRLTASYLDETLAFVVRDAWRDRFATWDSIRSSRRLRIGVPRVPYYIAKVRAELPEADLVLVDGVTDLFEPMTPPLDAAVLTAERGSSWTLLHPAYSVVVPQPRPLKIPLAYAVAARDEPLATFINAWIELKRKDGTIDELYAHWILGRDATPRRRRWSVLDDVLWKVRG